jgi:hypothetical protein
MDHSNFVPLDLQKGKESYSLWYQLPMLRVDSGDVTDDGGSSTLVRRHNNHGRLREEMRTR